jgi:hypothetical protein
MEYPNPNWKAVATKKFILSYYPQVESVEITYYTEDIPEVKVFFKQEDKRIPNEDWVLRQEIRKDVKDYLGFRLILPIMLSFEEGIAEPDMYLKVSSLNYDPFWRENEVNDD